MAAASALIGKEKEAAVVHDLVSDYCERRGLNPNVLLKKMGKDRSALYEAKLEKIDTLAYHIDIGKEQVREAIGKIAEYNFANDALLQKRLDGFRLNEGSSSLNADEVVQKVNNAKNHALKTGGGFVMRDTLIKDPNNEPQEQSMPPKRPSLG